MNDVKLSFDLEVSDPSRPLTFKVAINDNIIYDIQTTKSFYNFEYFIPDNHSKYKVNFIIDGKTDAHTVISDNNEIVSSAQITVKDIELDDINLSEMFFNNDDLITYTHNNNGYGDEIVDVFDACLGFNGVVEFTFETPLYVWLLDNAQ